MVDKVYLVAADLSPAKERCRFVHSVQYGDATGAVFQVQFTLNVDRFNGDGLFK